jgi:hypothetical protein
LWTEDGGNFNSRTVPLGKPHVLELLDLSGASVGGRWRGCHPALGQHRRASRPDAALAAAPGAAALPQLPNLDI